MMVIRLTIALLLLGSSIIHAQTESDSTYTKALSFRFNGLNLGGFRGGIGGKYWVSRNRAITASISLHHNSSETKPVGINEPNISDRESTNTVLGFFTGYEFHINRSERFSPYLGIGVSFSYSRSESDQTTIISSNDGVLLVAAKSKNETYRGDFETGLGVEYWVKSRISFAALQTFTIGFSNGSRNTTISTSTENFDTSSFSAKFGTSSLILSIYF